MPVTVLLPESIEYHEAGYLLNEYAAAAHHLVTCLPGYCYWGDGAATSPGCQGNQRPVNIG